MRIEIEISSFSPHHPISQPQRREATHRPKPSTRPERTTARTTRYTPTCGPNRGSLRMTSWRGGSCSRLPVFRFNVGIRGLCLCLRRHLSICRFVEFAIVGIWIGEKGEREMKSISYPKCSASRYTSPPQTERRRSNRCWRVRKSEQDQKRRLCTHNHRTQPYTASYSSLPTDVQTCVSSPNPVLVVLCPAVAVASFLSCCYPHLWRSTGRGHQEARSVTSGNSP
jgi:hypothetical protein